MYFRLSYSRITQSERWELNRSERCQQFRAKRPVNRHSRIERTRADPGAVMPQELRRPIEQEYTSAVCRKRGCFLFSLGAAARVHPSLSGSDLYRLLPLWWKNNQFDRNYFPVWSHFTPFLTTPTTVWLLNMCVIVLVLRKQRVTVCF